MQNALTPQIEAPWRERVLRAVESLRDIPENWDGERSLAPKAACINAALAAVPLLASQTSLPEPYVTAMPDGGVLLDWHVGPHRIDAEWEPSGDTAFVYLNTETRETDGGAAMAGDELSGAFLARLEKIERDG